MIRPKSWAVWFPIVRGQAAHRPGQSEVATINGLMVIGERIGWPTDIAANCKRWGMKP